MKKKALTIDGIIAENLNDNIELKFNLESDLLSDYPKFKDYLHFERMKYEFTIVAEFEYDNHTYKFYIDRKANAYQLRLYVVNNERYVLQRQYIGNLNPKFLSYFENVLRYVYLFDLGDIGKFSCYEPVFRIKIIKLRFDLLPKEFQDEFSDNDIFGSKEVSQTPGIVRKHKTQKSISSIEIGKKSEEVRNQYFVTKNIFEVELCLFNDYYVDGVKIKETKTVRKLIKNGVELEIDRYFGIKLNQKIYLPKNKTTSFAEEKQKEYSKHYLTLDDVLSDTLKLISECGKYIERLLQK